MVGRRRGWWSESPPPVSRVLYNQQILGVRGPAAASRDATSMRAAFLPWTYETRRRRYRLVGQERRERGRQPTENSDDASTVTEAIARGEGGSEPRVEHLRL